MLPLELYIHIPFCVKKCAYCDFLSAPSTAAEREAYVEMLCNEIEECRGRADAYGVTSIFFGGGTPSLMTGEQVGKILHTVYSTFQICRDTEITLEMNPGTVTADKLNCYKKEGINRLSIGLQSVHNEELRMLGRIHTYEEFLETYQLARKAGFENINIDLISAIPGQTPESWKEALEKVAALKPEHISAYSLIIEPETPFYEKYGEDEEQRKRELPDEDAERQMYWQTKEILGAAGYERYEISNYARPGYECRHNLGYWDRVPYLGFGIGAASLVPGNMLLHKAGTDERNEEKTGSMARYTNPDNIEAYQTCFRKKIDAALLRREEEMEEFMFLGLRKMAGISKEGFREYFQVGIEAVYGAQIEKLKRLELLQEEEDNIRLTEKGIDVSNGVFVEFMF